MPGIMTILRNQKKQLEMKHFKLHIHYGLTAVIMKVQAV